MYWSFLSALLPAAVAAASGAGTPFQAATNAALGRALGHPLWATLASLLISVLVVLPLLAVFRAPAPVLGAALQGPSWWWLGGVAGAFYVTAALVLTPKLGAAGFMVSVICGQMLASLAIDHFGLLGLTPKPANLLRIAGIALVLLGAVIVQLSYSTTSAPAASSAAQRS